MKLGFLKSERARVEALRLTQKNQSNEKNIQTNSGSQKKEEKNSSSEH